MWTEEIIVKMLRVIQFGLIVGAGIILCTACGLDSAMTTLAHIAEQAKSPRPSSPNSATDSKSSGTESNSSANGESNDADADSNTPSADGSCLDGKVLICLVPSGNQANAHDVCVAAPAVESLLDFGSYVGPCNREG